MAGKIKSMSTIKQLLQLHLQGKKIKPIASILKMSKNTVKTYLKKAKSDSLSINSLLALDDTTLEARFHAGSPAYKDDRFDKLKTQLDYYVKELSLVGVTRQLLWEEYRTETSNYYSYSQFCFHLQQHMLKLNPSMVLTHKPGDKLFIDFAGKKLSYVDPHSGEQIECQVFIACLPYSDYSFAMAVTSQKIEDFIHALNCCLQQIGGVPQAIVPDNLKSAVIKSGKYEPKINKALEDFGNHYGTVIYPTRTYKPQDKALVENQVKLIYTRVYAELRSQTFFDLESLNQAIAQKVKKHNQTRRQQKKQCREEQFLAEEKNLLSTLPAEPFELKYYARYTVAKNNHIYLGTDKHYYSVPYQFIGQKADVVYTSKLVKIYIQTKNVATHIRDRIPGRYSTTKEHLCSQHQHYKDRSPTYFKNRARQISDTFYELVKAIFEQDKYPEQLYKTCDGLFALSKKTKPSAFNKACQMALDYQQYKYGFILNILTNNMTGVEISHTNTLPKHDNVRGKEYYQKKLNI